MLKHNKFTKNTLNIMCKLIGHELAMKDRDVNSFSATIFCRRCGYSKKIGLKDFAKAIREINYRSTKLEEKWRKQI